LTILYTLLIKNATASKPAERLVSKGIVAKLFQIQTSEKGLKFFTQQ